MLYREIIAVCSQIHTKHINTLCGQNVKLSVVKPGGTLQVFHKQSRKQDIGTAVYHTFTNVCKQYFKGNAV